MKTQTFVIRDRRGLSRLMDFLGHVEVSPEHPKQVTFGDYSDKHSTSQRGLYFIWCAEIGRETGHSKEEMHLILKKKFLVPIIKKDLDGKELEWYTIKGLKSPQMSEYMEEIRAFAGSFLGIMLTEPGVTLVA